jgi:hypothetical protein
MLGGDAGEGGRHANGLAIGFEKEHASGPQPLIAREYQAWRYAEPVRNLTGGGGSAGGGEVLVYGESDLGIGVHTLLQGH